MQPLHLRLLPKLKESGCTDVSQPEISAYAELLTDHAGVRDSIVFERKVTRLRYIGRGAAVWEVSTVDTATGEPTDVVTCTHVVAANGPLSSPRLPEFDGMDEFQGESFHTAQWDQSASLAGKRVGVIGTGASAAQVITTIADEVEELLVFQRTPTWCVPRNDEPTPDDMRAQFEAGEGYAEALRKVSLSREPPCRPADVAAQADWNTCAGGLGGGSGRGERRRGHRLWRAARPGGQRQNMCRDRDGDQDASS